MTLTLDAATKSLLEQELNRGRFANASDLIAHALHLVQAEQQDPDQAEMENWLLRNKDAIRAALIETTAQAERGEGFTPEESQAHLAARRAERKSKAA